MQIPLINFYKLDIGLRAVQIQPADASHKCSHCAISFIFVQCCRRYFSLFLNMLLARDTFTCGDTTKQQSTGTYLFKYKGLCISLIL